MRLIPKRFIRWILFRLVIGPRIADYRTEDLVDYADNILEHGGDMDDVMAFLDLAGRHCHPESVQRAREVIVNRDRDD